jgi:phosphatidylserine/phosphatidylglycerophosphate/cardiolipin synthase-like enzyme
MKAIVLATILGSLILLLSSPHLRAAEMVVHTCFSPQGKCSNHILREIDTAKQELLVAVYAFTSDDLAASLARARRRGVAVQVIVDREFDRLNDNSKSKFLETQKIPVRRIAGLMSNPGEKDSGSMHQKFAVIDRRVVFTGSYNWTHSAESRNDENLLMFREAGPLADEYRKEFLRLWERRL